MEGCITFMDNKSCYWKDVNLPKLTYRFYPISSKSQISLLKLTSQLKIYVGKQKQKESHHRHGKMQRTRGSQDQK